MKNKFLLFIVAFVLTFCATPNSAISYHYKKIREIVVIRLPQELYTAIPILSEEEFDRHYLLKDTVRIAIDTFTLNLGTDKFQTKNIDIRTKVIICFTNGEEKVLLLDRFGQLLYKDKVSSGSIEALNFFRGEAIEDVPNE